jgi:hypothetical protein
MQNRAYDAESERQQVVENFYRINHINQTYGFVSKWNNNLSIHPKKKKKNIYLY